MPAAARLHIALLDSDPLIWRQVSVPASTPLDRLHAIIQAAMGWTNSHLHRFEGETEDGEAISYSMPYGLALEGDVDSRGVPLSTLLAEPGDSMLYEYDFGDGWEHLVTLQAIDPDGSLRAVCLDGANACPPEDSGGIWQYVDQREAYTDPSHPEHADLIEWLGGPFDPDTFDLDAANERLRRA